MPTTVIYIDVLFLLNLFLNYFILSAVAFFGRSKAGRLRRLGGAGLGALYACLMFFPQLGGLFTALAKLAASAVIVLVSFGFGGVFRFVKNLLGFYGMTLLFGGAALLAEFFLSPTDMIWNNGVFYINISPVVLLLVAAATYLLLCLGTHLVKPARETQLCTVAVTVDGARVELQALSDSGNLLTDALTGAFVMVADYAAIEPLLPPAVREFYRSGSTIVQLLEGTGWENRFAAVPYRAVGKQAGMLPAFRPDAVEVGGRPCGRKVIVAVEPAPLAADGSYRAIIHPSLAAS